MAATLSRGAPNPTKPTGAMRLVRKPHIPDAQLVPDIRAFNSRFVALPSPAHELVIATYVVHTYTIDVAQVTPYVYLHSNEPGTGKTRQLEVLAVLCRNAERGDDMTANIMFKRIEKIMPTLLIDEVDTIWRGYANAAKQRILNTGYRRGGVAWREQAREEKDFSTFSAKVLAGLYNGFLPSSLLDRTIPITMQQRRDDQTVERFNQLRVSRAKTTDALLGRIMQFAEEFGPEVAMQLPEDMPALSDRQFEISEPLLAIAAVLGYEQELRVALEQIFATAAKTVRSPEQAIFKRIYDAFAGQEKMFTDDLCAALGPMYNGRTLALWLEPYDIRPKNIRSGNTVLKGYNSDQFTAAWRKYLGALPAPQIEEEGEEAA